METEIDFKPMEIVKRRAHAGQPLRRALVGVTFSGGFIVPKMASVGHLFSAAAEEILIIMVLGMNVVTPVGTRIETVNGGGGGNPKAAPIRRWEVQRVLHHRVTPRPIS